MVAGALDAAVDAALNVVVDMFEAWKLRVCQWRFRSVVGYASARAVGCLNFENADFKRKLLECSDVGVMLRSRGWYVVFALVIHVTKN
jgi:hypothetical protein